MNLKIISSLLILLLVLLVPQVSAQTELISEISQKLVKVTIDSAGEVVVVHQIRNSDEPIQLKLMDGVISNLEFIDAVGRHESIEISKESNSVSILPNQGELFVQYNLDDVLMLEDNIWTWDFKYVHTVTFVIPEEAELLFVNERPIFLDGNNGFRCHGCQMVLEYLIDEPKHYEHVSWEDQEFVVEINTFADIEGFEFNQPRKQISFKVNDNDQFVTTIIPLELLWNPYTIFLDGEKIYFHEYINNGTHVWINIKPDTLGEITIMGTTVVPEFSMIAPFAVGFLIILMAPLVRKFSLH